MLDPCHLSISCLFLTYILLFYLGGCKREPCCCARRKCEDSSNIQNLQKRDKSEGDDLPQPTAAGVFSEALRDLGQEADDFDVSSRLELPSSKQNVG